jgi:hypothetical protein
MTGAAGAVAATVPVGTTSGVGVVVELVVVVVVVGSGKAAGRVRAKKKFIMSASNVPSTLTRPVKMVSSVELRSR